jgi:hypothetical protein
MQSIRGFIRFGCERGDEFPGKVVKLRPCISFPLVCVPPRNICTPDTLGHQSSGDGHEVSSDVRHKEKVSEYLMYWRDSY